MSVLIHSIPSVVLLLVTVALVVMSFVVKSKGKSLLIAFGSWVTYIISVSFTLNFIDGLNFEQLELVRDIDSNTYILGILATIIFIFFGISRCPDRLKYPFRMLIGLSLIIFFSGILYSISVYINISKEIKPEYTKLNVETVEIGKEYKTSDFVDATKTQGVTFCIIYWRNDKDNPTGIEISEDQTSFRITEGSGPLYIYMRVSNGYGSGFESVDFYPQVPEIGNSEATDQTSQQ